MSLIAIILATFISEDLACIAVGLLIYKGQLDPFVGLAGCYFGIFLGDLGLWLIGRGVGGRALRWKWVQRVLPEDKLIHWERWFDRRGWLAVLAARCVPGTRLPVYLAAGALGRRAWRFVLWAALAGLIWTPLLVGFVALAGRAIVAPLEAALGHAWLALLAVVAIVLAAERIVPRVFTRVGRAQLAAGAARIWRWEFWPAWLFYLPLWPWLGYLGLRHGGVTTPTAANPVMPHGGVVGESKYDLLRRLPGAWTAPTECIAPGDVADRVAVLRRAIETRGWSWPLVLKPDAGERGAGFKLIRTLDDAVAYFDRHAYSIIAQVYHPGPREAGVLYCRRPSHDRGRIFAITDKEFPTLLGDGVATLHELIWRHPRYRMQARRFLARLDGRADDVPAAGERVPLALAGNHCQGALFRDGARLWTPELEARVDEIARAVEGFYFGRFDLRYADEEEFRRGAGFTIIELNGVTSEATNIYDPSWSLWRAHRVLREQWQIAFEIGAENRRRGVRVTPLGELLEAVRAYYRGRDVPTLAD
jgi:membrane protein DedA with SNARE-associated domain